MPSFSVGWEWGIFLHILLFERTHRIPSRYQAHEYKQGSWFLQKSLSVLELCCKINHLFFFFLFVLFLVTVLLSLRRGLARYCKHKTLKAVSLFILENYRLCIPAHVVKNKLMNRVFSVNCYFYEWIERTCVIIMFSNSNTFSIYVIIYSIEPNFLQTSHLYYFVSIFPAF